MKTIRTKFLSLLLALVTILSLLPTAAFAASNTGSGLKITTNQAYWSTRLLANGTPYSYRPPLVDGKLVYCMDSGLGYHYATPSYLNSFTWTSGTGADADAVLQSAVTNSGLSEMDAATVENVKWMMTYLNDCKESNVGQLFMAVQTYVWENQSYKGEPGGDGDAGGYANADTYELYLSLIDSLLAKKAAEDAEFQRQIEEYKAQGIEASIVEDESAKWAVFAISSNRKNQSFFNYYGPRKLVTGEPAPDQPEQPTGGTGKIVLKKTAGGTTTGLAGARFSIYFNGQIVGSDITNAQGEIYVEDAATGLWSFVETSAPDGYCVDPTPKSVYVDVTEGDRESARSSSGRAAHPSSSTQGYIAGSRPDRNIPQGSNVPPNQTRKSNNSPAQQETRPIGIRNEPSAKGMFSAQRPDPAGNRADVSQGTLTRPTTGNRAAASKSVSMPSTLIKGSVKNSKEISSSRKQRREKHERK